MNDIPLKISISVLILSLILTGCNSYQKDQYQDKLNKVDALCIDYDSTTPGCALGIVYKGKLIYAKGYGMADIENQIPNSPDKLFDIASTSKQFTAFGILLLEESGKLSVNDKIRKYIPELPECYEPVLIKHLLTHTSGIRDHYALMDLTGIKEISSENQNWENHNYNEKQVFDILLNQRELNFEPGTYYQYCNSGFYLAGKIIERISDMALREFYQKNIFTPLGMNNTFLYDNYTFYHKNRTMGYSKTENGYRRNLIKYETYGDGQIMTNIYDLYTWDKNFYNNKLGKGNPGIIDKMYARGQLNSGQSIDYSIGGLEVSKYNELVVIDRMGGTQGICSDIVRFPDQEFTVICLSNYDDLSPDPWRASLKIADIFLKDEFTEEKQKLPATDKLVNLPGEYLQNFEGLYFNERSKEYCYVKYENGTLRMNNKRMIPIDSISFGVENWFTRIQFKKTTGGSYKMYWQSFTYPAEIYSKKKKAEYNEVSVSKFAGTYYCPELELNCEMKPNGNKISCISPDGECNTMLALFEGTFKSKYNGTDVLIEFTRNSNNGIEGLRMNTSWIKNLKFDLLCD